MLDSTDWRSSRFAVVDIEGNGRQPPEIVELGIVVVENGAIVGSPLEWLVRPAGRITRMVTAFHGITNEMVADAPSFAELVDTVIGVLSEHFLVAHNASVELGFLTRELSGWTPPGVVDTLRLARRLLAGRTSYALTALTKDFSLAEPSVLASGCPHRAAYDAMATARLFLRLATDESGAPRPLSALLTRHSIGDSAVGEQGNLF